MPRLRPTPPRALIVAAIACGAGGAAAQKVPEVVVGAAAADEAPRLEARVAEVTVFSDRARVRRRGRVALKGGAGVVRLPDLPGATFVDTIRVSVGAGRVLRVEATPVERERLAIDQAVKVLDELDAVSDRLAELDDRQAVDDWELALLTRLAPASPVPEEKREGRKGLVADVASWWKALDFIGARAGAARGRLVRLADERRLVGQRRDRLRADVAKLNRGGFSERLVQVLAVVDAGAAAGADLQLEYFVPGASWKPAYDLHFALARGQARLETAAVVQQATGEDWEQVALSFSTAIPGRGIDLPELLTWTLGERSEFVPHPRPRQPPPSEAGPALLPPPPPPAEAARAVDAEIVRERLARATADVTEGRYNRQRQFAEEAPAPAPPPPPRPQRRVHTSKVASNAPAGAPAAAPSMDYEEAEEAEAAPAPMLGRKSPLASAPAVRRSGAGVSYMPLGLIDATPPRRPPVLTDPYLPAVSAGGFDYVYQSPTPGTVPSTGRQIRIPLAAQSFGTTAFYEATPALAPTAYLRARVRNDGKRPLLRGPAAIFGDGEFVGNGEIKTTGASGEIELPLGADQDIRLVRQVVPSTKTTGLIIKSDQTTYDVQIQVGNYKKQAVTVEVVDQVPRSRNDKIQIQLLATNPAPVAAMDADGVLRFRVEVPAGATRTVSLRYQITRPKDWILY